jgi:hypothetical protein
MYLLTAPTFKSRTNISVFLQQPISNKDMNEVKNRHKKEIFNRQFTHLFGPVFAAD